MSKFQMAPLFWGNRLQVFIDISLGLLCFPVSENGDKLLSFFKAYSSWLAKRLVDNVGLFHVGQGMRRPLRIIVDEAAHLTGVGSNVAGDQLHYTGG